MKLTLLEENIDRSLQDKGISNSIHIGGYHKNWLMAPQEMKDLHSKEKRQSEETACRMGDYVLDGD